MSNASPVLEVEGQASPPAYESTYAVASRIVRSGVQGGSDWMPIVFLAIMLALPNSDGSAGSLASILVVVGSIVLRDLCGWAGMHLLDYPDKNLLYLPFLRKRVPETGDRAEAWRRGLILLLGPLSVLLLAFVAAVVTRALRIPAVNEAIGLVAMLNGFWLLPFGSFDGSRLLNLVLFSRSRILEVLFLLATSSAFIYLGVVVYKDAYWFVLFGALGVIRLPSRWRVRGAAAEMAAGYPTMPRRVEELEEGTMRALFDSVHRIVGVSARRATEEGRPTHAPVYAGMMRAVHAEAVLIPPSLPMSILLLFLYGTAIVLALLTVFMQYLPF